MNDDVIQLYTSTTSRLRVWTWTPNSILTRRESGLRGRPRFERAEFELLIDAKKLIYI